jgi:hypothetical protein
VRESTPGEIAAVVMFLSETLLRACPEVDELEAWKWIENEACRKCDELIAAREEEA